MRLLAIGALLLLAGCQNAGQRAEAEYQTMVDGNADSAELCRKSNEVAQAWTVVGDSKKYAEWREKSKLDCLDARLRQ